MANFSALGMRPHPLHPRVVRLCLHPKLYATRNLCTPDFLNLHHNCDAYMGVQKERKSTFLTALEHREKEARSLFAAQY